MQAMTLEEILIIGGIALFVIGAIALWITIYVLAHKKTNTLPVRICRWYWNTSWKVSSSFPMCGWMSRFIIADTAEEQAEKYDRMKRGQTSDAYFGNVLDEAVERRREADRAYQERIDLQNQLSRAAYREYGTDKVELTSDGSMGRIGSGEYIPIEELKRKLL